MFKIFIVICCICSSLFVCAQLPSTDSRISGWQSDIDTLLVKMKEQHYVYKSHPLPPQLLQKAAELKKRVPGFSDERMLLEMEKLMYYMHDGHSYMLPASTKLPPVSLMPLQFYVFSDGVFILAADAPYTDLTGDKVIAVNGTPTQKVLQDMQGYVHQDNVYTVKWFAPTFMRFRAVYEMYGLPAQSKNIELTLENRQHQQVKKTIEFVPAAPMRGIPKLIPSPLPGAPDPPLYLTRVAENFWFEKIPGSNTLYFQFNQVLDMPGMSIAQFSASLDAALTEIKPSLLLIDCRHNNGGNLMLLPPLMSAIRKFEKSNAASKIIVITGRNTFSAAQVFITQMNRDTHALFAGEPSGSSPNFVGEEGNMIILPWSGAIGNISNRYHETIPGDKRKFIAPDFPVSLSSSMYFANRDPVMEFLLHQFVKK